jgi:hypothetical protein
MKTGSEEWISLRESARRLSIDPMSFYRVLAEGEIRIRRLPGLQPRYSAADVEAVGRKYITSGSSR